MATYQQLIAKARITLNDEAGERYLDAEMFGYALDGLREAAIIRPDLFAVAVPMSLQAGVEQIIPPGSWFLISIERDADGNEVFKADYDSWRKFHPTWRTATPGPTEMWMPFPVPEGKRPPAKFYVYPPAVANAQVYGVVAQCDLSGQAIGGTFPLAEVYQPALVAYLIFRAETKDDQHVVTARVEAFHQKFAALLGVGAAAEVSAK